MQPYGLTCYALVYYQISNLRGVHLSSDFEYKVRKQNYDDRIEHFDAFYAHVGNFKSAEERAGVWWSCWNHICKKFTQGMLQIEKAGSHMLGVNLKLLCTKEEGNCSWTRFMLLQSRNVCPWVQKVATDDPGSNDSADRSSVGHTSYLV